MSLNPALFSSKTPIWATPQNFFDKLHAEFGFQIDVCALADNAKCDLFFSPEMDGLAQAWAPYRCWMNPPYGRTIGSWVKKAAEEAQRGATVVGLLPARTDTAWWHDYVMPYAEIRFVRGRLKFGGSADSAPFPNAVTVWRPSANVFA